MVDEYRQSYKAAGQPIGLPVCLPCSAPCLSKCIFAEMFGFLTFRESICTGHVPKHLIFLKRCELVGELLVLLQYMLVLFRTNSIHSEWIDLCLYMFMWAMFMWA